jgi:hypothetical protein
MNLGACGDSSSGPPTATSSTSSVIQTSRSTARFCAFGGDGFRRCVWRCPHPGDWLDVRFRGTVEFWVDVGNLDQAEQVVRAAEQAAHAALGRAAIDDPQSGALSGHLYEAIDDAARAELDKADLGHGVSGRTFRH